MKKLIGFDDRAKKYVTSVIVLAFLGTIVMSMFMGCTGEDVDKAKDTAGRIIDIIDNVDEVEKEIEGILDEAVEPKDVADAVSGVMMNDQFPQGGIVPPSSPNRTRGVGSNSGLVVCVCQIPAPKPIPPRPLPSERPSLPYTQPVLSILPDIPVIITEPILLPTDIFGPIVDIAYDYVDFEGTLLFPEFGTSPGCLFDNACWNGCA